MQEENEQNHYLLQVEKLMSSDILSTYWSHNMDLLAIVTVDNLLQLYRINFKAQKVFQLQQQKQISTVAFSPDSQHIAYAMTDGDIKVLKTENGQTLLTVNDHTNDQIKSFTFVEFAYCPINQIFPFKSTPIMEKLILPISPHKNCNKPSIVKLNYFSELTDDDQFTLLLSSSEKHTSLHMNGFMTIAKINYNQIAHDNFSQNDYTVYHSNFNPKTCLLQSILIQSTQQSYILHHIEFTSTSIKHLQQDIIKFHTLLNYITQILSFIQHSYPTLQTTLRDILRQYNQKINLIDDPQQQGINPCTELFKYLNCGITSTSLLNFLTKEVYDTKVLQKLDEVINAGFNSLHDLLLQSVQNSLERAYLIVQELKGLAGLDKYLVFGVKVQDLQVVENMIEKLYTMGEILLVESTEAKFDIRNLLVWLNKATCKTATDPTVEIQNTKSHLSRYTVDFTRLHAFLQTEGKFRMQNLLSFFAKGQQSFTMHIPACEFRLLNSQNQQQSSQYHTRTKQLQQLLQLQDISLQPQNYSTTRELSYKSFKLQLKQTKLQWTTLLAKPITELSKNIEKHYTINTIGEVPASELVIFNPKVILKKNTTSEDELILYYISQLAQRDTIVQYNTSTKSHKSITLPQNCQPIAIAVGVDVILLSQNTDSMNDQKQIVQVVNQQWQGEELVGGKRIDKLSGEVVIDAGLRGLNLMVVNKNKLVVFD